MADFSLAKMEMVPTVWFIPFHLVCCSWTVVEFSNWMDVQRRDLRAGCMGYVGVEEETAHHALA